MNLKMILERGCFAMFSGQNVSRVLALCSSLLVSAGVPDLAGAQATEMSSIDMITRERIVRVPATVRDGYGKSISGELIVTIFRPPGDGPFPLAVISHGRDSVRRATMSRPRYVDAALVFARKGFAVAVPQRLGYGELAAVGDPEDSMSCSAPRYSPALEAAARQLDAVVRHLHTEPDIDRRQTFLVGQSLGGMASIAATAIDIPGLAGAINFAGGHGGRPETHPSDPCSAPTLTRAIAAWGARSKVPTLWIYSENDRYFAPQIAQRWHAAFVQAGGQATLHMLGPFGSDGHNLFSGGVSTWQPLVIDFLLKIRTQAPKHSDQSTQDQGGKE